MKEELEKLYLDEDFTNQLSQSLFESQHKPITNIYVDMATMFDYRVAALIKMAKTEMEYKYISHQIKSDGEYSQYKGREITKCFPALKYSENDISKFLKDPKNIEFLSFAGLLTNVSNLVPAQVFFADHVNKQSPLYDNEPINIYFVNELFMPSEQSCLQIRNSLTSLFSNLNCQFRHKKINMEDEEFLSKMDVFILDDMMDFTKENTNSANLLFNKRKLLGSIIQATYRLDEESPYMSDEGEERIQNTAKQLNMFCSFMFFDKQLISTQQMETSNDSTAFTHDR